MSSTGEVGCIGDNLDEALLKSILSVGNTIPAKRILLSTGDALQKADMLTACKMLAEKGYELYATGGTYKYFIENKRASLWDMLLPIIVLLVCCVVGMLYVGGFWAEDGETYRDIIGAFGDTDAFVALPWGSLIAVCFSFLYLLARRVVSFKDATTSFVNGFNAMVPAILVLTFAVSLKNMTGMLGAAEYVYGVMQGASQSLYNMLPAIIFLVGCGLAFSTGTSWGTFGILMPQWMVK